MSIYTGQKGQVLENLIKLANQQYLYRGLASVDKVETTVTVKRTKNDITGENEITGATHKGGPKVDFKGTLFYKRPVAFDAKETSNAHGLPLGDIRDNQIYYFELNIPFGEICFLVVYSSIRDKYYRVDATAAVSAYRYWESVKGTKAARGSAVMLFESMEEIYPQYGIHLDYLAGWYNEADVVAGSELAAALPERAVMAFTNRGGRR